MWHIPEQMPPRYSATDGQNSCVGVWTSHKDVIWELHHHNTEVSGTLSLEPTNFSEFGWNGETME